MSDFDPDGLDGVPARAAEAAAAIAALREPAERAADAIDEAFAKAGLGLARSLAHAAADGKVTLSELAQAVLGAVDGAGGASRGGGLAQVLAGVLKSTFSGARADGGPVSGGGAYLVGERGPEVFRPAGAGSVEPLNGGGLNVTVNVQGADTGGLARSDAQLAQALARAVSLGARRL